MRHQLPAGAAPARRRREQNTLAAAALTNGPNELIDFVLPLWAGTVLGLTATEVGILLTVEMAVSVISRPLAGVLVDTRERRYIAVFGALLYAASCAGYALASSAPHAYVAAAFGGVGGALLWVTIRAIVSERHGEDSAVFPRLLAASENGTWVAFLAGMFALDAIGFSGVFFACAAACVLAALVLLFTPRRRAQGRVFEGSAAAGLSAVGRRLRPLLLAVILTMTAESAVMLLLLLHLQRGFNLEVVQVAYVFLPGAITMAVAAEYLHRYVQRFGRRRVLIFASLCSAAFAAGLAFAPYPAVIAALWILSGLAWAAVMPIQQAVIAEASGDRVGRGMGLYESASLVGGSIGSLTAGVLYDSSSFAVACGAAAVVILAGAVVVPGALRRLGTVDVPPDVPPEVPREEGETGTDFVPPVTSEPVREATPDSVLAVADAEPTTMRQRLVDLGAHAVLCLGAQVVLAFFGLSAAYDLIAGDTLAVLRGDDEHAGMAATLYGVGKVWAFILVVDLLWTGARALATLLRRRAM